MPWQVGYTRPYRASGLYKTRYSSLQSMRMVHHTLYAIPWDLRTILPRQRSRRQALSILLLHQPQIATGRKYIGPKNGAVLMKICTVMYGHSRWLMPRYHHMGM